jgi:hypothetical protein
MVTYNTDPEAATPPSMDLEARFGQVMPTTDPLTGETTNPLPDPAQPVTAPAADPAPVEGQPEAAPSTVPDKYKGKTAEELIRMHQEAEKAMHSRDEEVRISRAYLDRALSQQAKATEPPPPVPTTLPSDDVKMLELMLSKPTEFKKALVAELVGGLQQSSVQAETQRIFNENRAVISTPEFGKFLQTVPPSVCQQADRDPAVLSYLLNSYKASTAPAAAPTNPVDNAERARATAAKTAQARTAPGGANAAQPTFTRMQLMEMQLKQPDKYEAMQPQIIAAYAQGLVGD